MSESRAFVLSAVRAALRKRPAGGGAAEADERLTAHAQGPVPARGRLDPEARVALFRAEAERVQATTDRVVKLADIPAAVAAYLAAHNLPTQLRAAPDPLLQGVPWRTQSLLSVDYGLATGDDQVGVSAAFAGVAETGTLVLLSGPASPTTLALLPPTHVVVVPTARIAASYEDVWSALRARGAGGKEFMPRAVNWITGPSRTADLEQTLLLGAHGPQRLHIVVVDEEEPQS